MDDLHFLILETLGEQDKLEIRLNDELLDKDYNTILSRIFIEQTGEELQTKGIIQDNSIPIYHKIRSEIIDKTGLKKGLFLSDNQYIHEFQLDDSPTFSDKELDGYKLKMSSLSINPTGISDENIKEKSFGTRFFEWASEKYIRRDHFKKIAGYTTLTAVLIGLTIGAGNLAINAYQSNKEKARIERLARDKQREAERIAQEKEEAKARARRKAEAEKEMIQLKKETIREMKNLSSEVKELQDYSLEDDTDHLIGYYAGIAAEQFADSNYTLTAAALQDLKSIKNELHHEWKEVIWGGTWRRYKDSRTGNITKHYYLNVDRKEIPTGKLLIAKITDWEQGAERQNSTYGVKVTNATYLSVGRDKNSHGGRINNNIFAIKPKRYLNRKVRPSFDAIKDNEGHVLTIMESKLDMRSR